MADRMTLRVFDVEHGACAMLQPIEATGAGRLAMIDSGHNSNTGWRPSTYIRNDLQRRALDYLFITNADRDHLSDLDGLWDEGINVNVLYRNSSPSEPILREIKRNQHELDRDIERFLQIHGTYNHPITYPFNDHMGGIIQTNFANTYPSFTDTNNLSLVVFIEFAGITFLFPGDLEVDGWLSLLENQAFRAIMEQTHNLHISV